MENLQTTKEGIRSWFAESVLVKVVLIAFLTLLLLIPSSWIQDLISERQSRQEEVNNEISNNWSGSQLIQGPVMVIPYKTLILEKNSAGKSVQREIYSNIYLLPEELNIHSQAEPMTLKRGIFEVVVYNTKVRVNGKFSALELKKSGIDPAMVQWDKAKIDIGLSDLKGLKNNPVIHLEKTAYKVEPDFGSLSLFRNNLIIMPDLSTGKNTALNFNFDLDLRGSSELNFMHLGKITTVKIDGNWNSPKFTGRYLPDERKITDKSFHASWKLPYFNRPFAQQWIATNASIKDTESKDSAFGVKFILPVDQYQKTTRSAKYAILIILLTFVSLFFTEMIGKKKVHLLQYVLIGVAMSIYYTLLLSLSEQFGFDIAYLIASIATVGLVGTFIAMLLNNKKTAAVFSCILSVFYSFIYVIIQLEDLALLFGSVGLFVIVATMMYLSAKMDWNKQAALPEETN